MARIWNKHKLAKTLLKKKVFVGMSGGVDSSVAAWLLKKRGYEVVGVFLRGWSVDGCADRDAEDARRAAGAIGVPFYVWDFEEEYRRRVVDYMIDGYRRGVTPNPDVMCNKEIKFGVFFERAMAMGADFVATGHYVRLVRGKGLSAGISHLFAAKDTNKDQCYFLWTLTQNELAHCLFPIGDFRKPEVRELARRAGLPTAEKKDSQGICFLGRVSMGEFLRAFLPEQRGALVTTAGEKIGEHYGSHFYTIGQRHIDADFSFPKTGGRADRLPFYVAAKDAATNTVFVAEGVGNDALYRREVELGSVNLIALIAAQAVVPTEVYARVRYRQPLAKARLSRNPLASGSGGEDGADVWRLVFAKPQKFVAPGQSAVFHSKSGEMLGGGVIL